MTQVQQNAKKTLWWQETKFSLSYSRKQFEKMSKENQSASLTDCAELVLSLTEGERMDLLNKHYGGREPKLKDILTGTQHSELEEPGKSKRSQGELDSINIIEKL